MVTINPPPPGPTFAQRPAVVAGLRAGDGRVKYLRWAGHQQFMIEGRLAFIIQRMREAAPEVERLQTLKPSDLLR